MALQIRNFLSNGANTQTNKQTNIDNKPTQQKA